MKIPKPIRKHVKRINRRKYGSHNFWKSPKHKRIKLKEVKWYLKGETDYCPCCGSSPTNKYPSIHSCSLCRPDMTNYSQFKQEVKELDFTTFLATFLHKSGQMWRKWY
jgi:hypothetical protein